MITTVVVSRNFMLRSGFRTRLNNDPEIAVVAEVGIRKAISELLARQPDVVVVDHTPPQIEAVQFIEQVQNTGLSTRVVVVSDVTECRFVHRVMQMGASGYLGKSLPPSMLITAIKTAAYGYRFVDPLLVATLIAPDREQLSARELEVLQLFSDGLSTRTIADELAVRETTVHANIRSTMAKLGAGSRGEAVEMGRQGSLIS